jgi:predicted aldo/keto reductase-like oxidoreductase
MQYRDIGKTGKKASMIGLGGEHLDGKPYKQVEDTIKTALEHGVNLMDVFMPGKEVRENIAKALGNRRKDVFIQGHIGSTNINQQYDISRDMPTVKRYFEDCLRIFGGYIDFGMLFFIDSEEDYRGVFDGGLADYAQKLKDKGDIGHIGFSSHNPEMAAKVIQTGLPEIMMFSINLAFDLCPPDTYALDALEQDWRDAGFHGIDPERASLYTLCEQKGVGISVMKTLGAGKLISPEHTPFSRPMTVNQCIHYALSRPAVCSALLGCQTGDEIKGALGYFGANETDKDYTPFLNELKNDFKGHCVYCNHCLPCPAEIDIAAVNKYLDIARLDEKNIPPSIRSHYGSLARGGADCISCGSCESRCPFGVPVMDNMAQAARLFSE